MFKSIYQRVGLSLVAAALTTSVAYAQDDKEINFGIISTESSQNLRQV